MAQPGTFQPRGEDFLIRKLQELEARVARNEAANVFGLTGIKPKDGGTDLDGFVNVNGDMTITGALNLPSGIINNDALAAPIETQTIYADADGFTLTPAEQDFCTTSFTVPAGYTTAVIVATGTVNGYNTNGSADYLWARAYIDSSFGRRMFALMMATSGPASLTVNKQVQLTGLEDDQVITCKLKLSSQVADVTSGSNGASMNAFALFTR
jgi:hypothetical protein